MKKNYLLWTVITLLGMLTYSCCIQLFTGDCFNCEEDTHADLKSYLNKHGYKFTLDLDGNPISSNQLMVRINPRASSDSIEGLKSQLNVIDSIKCPCGDKSVQLWEFDLNDTIPIEEKSATVVNDTSEVQEAEYNYIIADIPKPFLNEQNVSRDTSENKELYPKMTGIISRNAQVNDKRILAIMDSGIDYGHPGLNNFSNMNLWKNEPNADCNHANASKYQFDYGINYVHDETAEDKHGHGTHVAGISAKLLNSDPSMYYELMVLKTHDERGLSSSFNVKCAIQSANEHAADVVNMSFGWQGPESEMISEALSIAQNNVIFVCSAGNKKMPNDQFPHYPSDFAYSDVISIAASNQVRGPLASFSNYGKIQVDYVVEGVEIMSLLPVTSNNPLNKGKQSGTSMAAPNASAAILKLLNCSGLVTPSNVKSVLDTLVQPVAVYQDSISSAGYLDYFSICP